jgi:hypothetical protein
MTSSTSSSRCCCRSPRVISSDAVGPSVAGSPSGWTSPRELLIDISDRCRSIYRSIAELDIASGWCVVSSGSATPADDVTRHTGMGRFGRVRLRPMSLAESGASTARVSLSELAAGVQRVSAHADGASRETLDWDAARTNLVRLACESGDQPKPRDLGRSPARRPVRRVSGRDGESHAPPAASPLRRRPVPSPA